MSETPETPAARPVLSAEGLIKTYDPAFTADNHDALNENDYVMVRYTDKGEIVPVKGK